MNPRSEPSIPIHRRRDRDGRPTNDRRLAREIEQGTYVRVAPGSFVPGDAWRKLRPIDRHHLRVVEVVDRVRSPLLISHFAAAAVWGIDLIGTWPDTVDVLVSRSSGGRSSGSFRRRTTTRRAEVATAEWRCHAITTPAQTALDLARVGTFTRGVIALDQARWARRPDGALATRADLEAIFDADPRARGRGNAAAALEFSTDLSDSVRESEGRVLIDRLGFPAPVLRRLVAAFSRWRTPAHKDPRRLYDILTGAGLPSRLSRPPAGLTWG
ncbi:hypothetical protein [Microbacterium aureliae]